MSLMCVKGTYIGLFAHLSIYYGYLSIRNLVTIVENIISVGPMGIYLSRLIFCLVKNLNVSSTSSVSSILKRSNIKSISKEMCTIRLLITKNSANS